MSEKLAILGGEAMRKVPFPEYRTIGSEEKQAVADVMDDGVLSQFLGTWSTDFFGGPRVQKIEREWERYFQVKHAVTMNSATSCLYAAVGASGAGPGDEVIVSPYTMAASATAAVVYGAIPVFADIDPRTFCLSAETIRERLTPHTKAIVVVDIFGYPVDFEPIMALARERGIVVIEDAAQAPGARRNGKWAGTLADIGVFSLNYHKTIHTGEGGVAVTNDDRLAERLQLIRNHAEVVVRAKGTEDIANMVGFNYRMTEIEAAIGSEQLRKLERLVSARVTLADRLTAGLRGITGITVPEAEHEIRHGNYLYTVRYDRNVFGVSRDRFAAALRAEGLPISEGYVRPIYLEPMYQRKIAFGRDGFPFTYSGYKGSVSYDRGICPVAEQMHFDEVLCLSIVHAGATVADMDDAIAIFMKVVAGMDQLRNGIDAEVTSTGVATSDVDTRPTTDADEASRELLIANYRGLFKTHGDGPDAVQLSAKGQVFRFNKLLEIDELDGKSVLDIGCGLGAMYEHLTAKFGDVNYCGIDILQEFVDAASAKYPLARFIRHDLAERPLPEQFDYVLVSSVFNNALPNADVYMERLLRAAFAHARVGLGFNFISDRVNFRNETMAYHDVGRVLDFCLRELTTRVRLEHHYERCDVVVFAYR